MSENTIKWTEQFKGNTHDIHDTIVRNGEEYVITAWCHRIYELEVTYEAMPKDKWKQLNYENVELTNNTR